jgi:hypothetical protein
MPIATRGLETGQLHKLRPKGRPSLEQLNGLRFREQIGNGHTKRVGDARDIAERGITQSQFYTAEVGPVDSGLLRQFLLGQMFCLTQLPHRRGEVSDCPVLKVQAPSLLLCII